MNSMSSANVIPKISLWYSNNSLACKMKCRTYSHQLKLQFNLYKCILFKPPTDANIQSKNKRWNLHMRCAFIYQLIHCDVARYANKICNRLKPTAAFIFFFLPSSVLSLSCKQKMPLKPQNIIAPSIHISASWFALGVVSSVKWKEMKWKQCQLYYSTNCFHFAFACRS